MGSYRVPRSSRDSIRSLAEPVNIRRYRSTRDVDSYARTSMSHIGAVAVVSGTTVLAVSPKRSVIRLPTSLVETRAESFVGRDGAGLASTCLLYTSDAADERSSVDLG